MTISENLVFEAGVLIEKLSLKYKIPYHQAIIYGFAGLELLTKSNGLHLGELRESVQSLLERLYREEKTGIKNDNKP